MTRIRDTSPSARRVSQKRVSRALGARLPRVDQTIYILLPKGQPWKPKVCETYPEVKDIDERLFCDLQSAQRWLKACGPDVEVNFEPVPVQMREIGVQYETLS